MQLWLLNEAYLILNLIRIDPWIAWFSSALSDSYVMNTSVPTKEWKEHPKDDAYASYPAVVITV